MIAASTVVTAILQGSSVVLLMVLSFVGAGLINMRSALAAVIGSNLGTTLVNWVIATVGFKLNIGGFSFPILACSLWGLLLARKGTRFYNATRFLIGLALIFVALDWLKGSLDLTVDSSSVILKDWHYLFFVPLGFVITLIIQSSSATVTITLAALFNQLLPFESAAAMVIGSELGTTIKFLLGSIGGIPDKKRVALGNFILNFITTIIAVIFLHPIIYIIQKVAGISDPLIGLVFFQTSINLLSIILFFPALGIFANFLDRFFDDKNSDRFSIFIRKSTVALPGDALELARRETIHLIGHAIDLNKMVLGLKKTEEKNWRVNLRQFTSSSWTYEEAYSDMKQLQGEILEYITEIPKSEMTETEIELTGKLMNITRYILRAAKNIKDIRHNLEEFKSNVNDDLYNLYTKLQVKVQEFYSEFEVLVGEPEGVNSKMIDKMNAGNQYQYRESIAAMMFLLKDEKINQLNSSDLINVYREVYSSNKALIQALADLKDVDSD